MIFFQLHLHLLSSCPSCLHLTLQKSPLNYLESRGYVICEQYTHQDPRWGLSGGHMFREAMEFIM